jgi:hypothetical protein
MTRIILLVVVTVLAASVVGLAAGGRPADAAAAKPGQDQASREKWFAELLTNADLVGSFTTEGRDAPPKEDRYTILKAVKGEGENWVLTAKIGYKGISVPLDITVPVKWAGDTPMIQMTDQKVPGYGAFTVRLMFYGKHYAGTWSAGDHGGLMWGRIERAGAGATTKPTTRPARLP